MDLKNPFGTEQMSEVNDLGDFRLPYKYYGREDYRNLRYKYQRLDNYSKGIVVRLINNNG